MFGRFSGEEGFIFKLQIVYSPVPNCRGVVLPILPRKRPKMAIFENINKHFEKSKRVEALK